MYSQRIVFSFAMPMHELPFTDGFFQIKDILVDSRIDYSILAIYFRFELENKTLATRTYHFKEIIPDNGYYKFQFERVPENCIKCYVSIIPTIPKEMIILDVDYNF